MKVEGSAALITGANRGLGAAIAQAFLDSGAKVYGAARDTTSTRDLKRTWRSLTWSESASNWTYLLPKLFATVMPRSPRNVIVVNIEQVLFVAYCEPGDRAWPCRHKCRGPQVAAEVGSTRWMVLTRSIDVSNEAILLTPLVSALATR